MSGSAQGSHSSRTAAAAGAGARNFERREAGGRGVEEVMGQLTKRARNPFRRRVGLFSILLTFAKRRGVSGAQ